MKLFLLQQEYNRGYDTHDSCVVAAPTAIDAKKMSPDPAREWNEELQCFEFVFSDGTREPDEYASWAPPKYVKVTFLGEAKPDTKAGIILASFNAG